MPHVIKLGGSLMDLTDLPQRLGQWLSHDGSAERLLVVGGGVSADVVRDMDAHHRLGPVVSHWLAIRAMEFNAHVVGMILAHAGVDNRMVADLQQAREAWAAGALAVLAPLPWLLQEDGQGITIPHRWSFTSDSVAAHIACGVGAERLTLLKSTLPTVGEAGTASARDVAQAGILDADFPATARQIPHVWLQNLRAGPAARVRLTF